MENTEIWKDVVHCKDYQVSNMGRARSFKRGKETILKQIKNGRGYLSICMYYNKKGNIKRVHVLIAESFLNHKPDGTTNLSVDHIDNNQLNNKLENLQIISHSENICKEVTNPTGYLGIRRSNGGRFYAHHTVKNKSVHLGTFDTAIEASEAYQKAKKLILNK